MDAFQLPMAVPLRSQGRLDFGQVDTPPGRVQADPESRRDGVEMDYETVDAADFGAALRGLGLNLLVRDVRATAGFLKQVFGMTIHRLSDDFAIVVYGTQAFQLHSDGTYSNNPLLGLLPENPPRGAGIELRLYDTDPDLAIELARATDATVLASPADKPHGLREAYILDTDGYAWVPSRPLAKSAD
jgi:hypothetical protein